MPSPNPHAQLRDRLKELRRRLGGVGFLSAAAWAALAGFVLLALAMAVDLLTELPGGFRLALALAAVAAASGTLVALVVLARQALRLFAIARRVDDFRRSSGQVLTGVDVMLDPRVAGAPALTSGLASLAVEQAATIALGAMPREIAPVSMARRPAYSLLGLVGLMALMAVLVPRLVATQLARFGDPFGDHPPYSRNQFAVEPGHARVAFGKSLDVTAVVRGGLVDEVELVSRFGDDDEAILPMFQQAAGTWKTTIANVTADGEYYVRAVGGRSRRSTIEVVMIPRVEDVEFTITPPAYTRLAAYRGALPPGGIDALPGTRVELRVASNRPLRRGTLSTDGTPIATLAAAESRPLEVTGGFEVEQPAAMRIDLTDVEGCPSDVPFEFSVKLLSDLRPFVRITEPINPSLATPDASVVVRVQAEDDFGISRLDLYRSLNDSRPLPVELPVPSPPEARLEAGSTLPLGQLGVAPGDTIKLFARVEDNRPGGAQGSESEVTVLRIISQEEMNQLLVARQGIEAMQGRYQEAARRLEGIAQRIEDLQEALASVDPESPAAESIRQELRDLAAAMEEEAAAIERLAAHPLPLDLDRNLAPRLEEMARSLRQEAGTLNRLAGESGLSCRGARDALEQARAALAGDRERLQREATEPVEHLARVLPLLQEQEHFIAIARAQRDLADRLAAVRDQGSVEDPRTRLRLRELEDEQRLLAAELGDLLDDVEAKASALPEDPMFEQLRRTALAFAKAVRQSPAQEQMRDARNAMAAFDGERAAGRSAAAADTLEEFISQCNGMGEEGTMCLSFQPKLAAAMGQTVQQLLAAASTSLGLGNGFARGAGSGYGTTRSTLQNVGLYGSVPVQSSAAAEAGGGSADRGAATDGRSALPGAGAASRFNITWRMSACGAVDVPVPAQYRDRVSEYFRRVADELGNGGPP